MAARRRPSTSIAAKPSARSTGGPTTAGRRDPVPRRERVGRRAERGDRRDHVVLVRLLQPRHHGRRRPAGVDQRAEEQGMLRQPLLERRQRRRVARRRPGPPRRRSSCWSSGRGCAMVRFAALRARLRAIAGRRSSASRASSTAQSSGIASSDSIRCTPSIRSGATAAASSATRSMPGGRQQLGVVVDHEHEVVVAERARPPADRPAMYGSSSAKNDLIDCS